MADRVTKKYTADFKQPLVERYLQGGTTLKAIAQEAKISPDTLSSWAKAYPKENPSTVQKTDAPKKAKAPVSKAPKAKKHPMPESDTLAELRKQLTLVSEALALVTEERDVLKRAVRIFSANP